MWDALQLKCSWSSLSLHLLVARGGRGDWRWGAPFAVGQLFRSLWEISWCSLFTLGTISLQAVSESSTMESQVQIRTSLDPTAII